jgi:hypothetical protein
MFNKERIAKMKKGVIIVNNARGAIMDTQAVADACSSGHIAGTCIHPFISLAFYILFICLSDCTDGVHEVYNFHEAFHASNFVKSVLKKYEAMV